MDTTCSGCSFSDMEVKPRTSENRKAKINGIYAIPIIQILDYFGYFFLGGVVAVGVLDVNYRIACLPDRHTASWGGPRIFYMAKVFRQNKRIYVDLF